MGLIQPDPHSLRHWARELRISYFRFYRAARRAGVRRIESKEDLMPIVIEMQKQAIPFVTLCRVFGNDYELGMFALLEVSRDADVRAP